MLTFTFFSAMINFRIGVTDMVVLVHHTDLGGNRMRPMGSMKFPVIFTVLLIVAGYVCFIVPNFAAPVLALLLIYFVWKTYSFGNEALYLEEQLREIRELLEQKGEAAKPESSTPASVEENRKTEKDSSEV